MAPVYGTSNEMKGGLRNPEVLSLALLSCVVSLVPVFAPMGGGILSLIAPFPLIVLAVKYPWSYVASLVVLEGAIVLMAGQRAPLVLLAQHLLIALAMAQAIRRGWSISRAIVGSLMVPLGIGALVVLLYGAVAQQWPQTLVTRYTDQVIRLSQEYVQALGDMQEGEDEQLAALAAALPQLIVAVLPALLAISHLFTNVFHYILVRRYGQKSQPPLHIDPEDVTGWRASDYLIWVFVASGVVLLIPNDTVSIIGLNVLLVTLAVYLLQGLAIALFWGRRLPVPAWAQCLVVGFLLLVAGPLCVIGCTAAGLFDLWVDFRRQRRHSLLP